MNTKEYHCSETANSTGAGTETSADPGMSSGTYQVVGRNQRPLQAWARVWDQGVDLSKDHYRSRRESGTYVKLGLVGLGLTTRVTDSPNNTN